MSSYSIVFLDIDGTLLNSQHQVMPCTHQCLQGLRRRGVPIVLCSARPPEGVNLVADQVELYGPKACYNGGLIYDEHSSILRMWASTSGWQWTSGGSRQSGFRSWW